MVSFSRIIFYNMRQLGHVHHLLNCALSINMCTYYPITDSFSSVSDTILSEEGDCDSGRKEYKNHYLLKACETKWRKSIRSQSLTTKLVLYREISFKKFLLRILKSGNDSYSQMTYLIQMITQLTELLIMRTLQNLKTLLVNH